MAAKSLSREGLGQGLAILGVLLVVIACVGWVMNQPVAGLAPGRFFWVGILALILSFLVARDMRWPGVARSSAVGRWVRGNLFSNSWNAVLTLVAIYLLVKLLPPALDWLFFNAIWKEGPPETCNAAEGACWTFIREKYRVIFFGRYPYDEQWRPLLGIGILISLVLVSCFRRMWRRDLGLIWLAGLAAFGTLMFGGFGELTFHVLVILEIALLIYAIIKIRKRAGPGQVGWIIAGAILYAVLAWIAYGGFEFSKYAPMTFVPTSLWGGLPLTLLLSILGILVAFPLAILLALGRRSKMPLIRSFCIGYIELIRGVPLISLLFVASFLLPLFLPAGVEIDALLRAQVAIIGFSAAYLAEVIRGGLQAIPRGQFEAADALGLGFWQKMGKIILPQAITLVIPPIVNTFIGLFKDTSLVGIVSLTDLLLATKDLAIADVNWRRFYAEGYTVCALIYFVFCFFMSKYSQHLERTFETGRQKRR